VIPCPHLATSHAPPRLLRRGEPRHHRNRGKRARARQGRPRPSGGAGGAKRVQGGLPNRDTLPRPSATPPAGASPFRSAGPRTPSTVASSPRVGVHGQGSRSGSTGRLPISHQSILSSNEKDHHHTKAYDHLYNQRTICLASDLLRLCRTLLPPYYDRTYKLQQIKLLLVSFF
jgi:hypothetical protein